MTQQTEKYKLNLIEATDTFSPQALNENAQKLEQVLSDQMEAVAGQTADLDGRVAVLGAKKLAVGSYTGNGNNTAARNIDVGFKPFLILVQDQAGPNTAVAITGKNMLMYSASAVSIAGNGFKIHSIANGSYWNLDGRSYVYFALG